MVTITIEVKEIIEHAVAQFQVVYPDYQPQVSVELTDDMRLIVQVEKCVTE